MRLRIGLDLAGILMCVIVLAALALLTFLPSLNALGFGLLAALVAAAFFAESRIRKERARVSVAIDRHRGQL